MQFAFISVVRVYCCMSSCEAVVENCLEQKCVGAEKKLLRDEVLVLLMSSSSAHELRV